MAKPSPPPFDKQKTVAENRRARFDYFVDERFEAGDGRLPPHHLPACLVEHPRTDGHDEAGLLGDGDEVARQQQAAFGVLPPQQRLDAGHAPRGQVDHRLVVDAQLAAPQRTAQRVLDVETIDGAGAHRVVEHDPTCPAAILRLVHRGVGIADERFRIGLVVVRKRDADAHTNEHLGVVDDERSGHGFVDPLGDGYRVVKAALHKLAAEIELATPTNEGWGVVTEDYNESGRVYLELVDATPAEAARAMALLTKLTS